MNNKKIVFLSLRYFILLFIGLFGLELIYFLIAPLTIYPSFFFINLIYPSSILLENTISLFNFSIVIVPACIAGAAYYLLLILNITTPMKTKTRICNLLFLVFSFLFLNIIRIVFFSVLFIEGFRYFDITHRVFWYIGSTLLIVFLWFMGAYVFKIKDIPVFTDFKNLKSQIR